MRIAARNALLTIATLAATAVAQGNPPAPIPAPQDNGKIIQFLSSTLSWYRQRSAEEKLASEPADLSFEQENNTISDQVVQQAFEYARNEAQRQSNRQPATTQQRANTGQYQRLAQALQKVEQQIQDTQTELQTTREKLARSGIAKRRTLQAQVEELQGELGLLNARHDALQTMSEFVSSSGTGNRLGLRAQVEELARSVPAALSGSPNANASQAKTQPTSILAPKAPPSGIWGLSTDLLHLSGKRRTLAGMLSSTEALRKSADDLRAPLISDLQNLIHQGDQLFAAADTATAAGLVQQTQQLDALTAQFKQVTSTMLPLSKVGVLLGIYETTLKNWRESIRNEERDDLRQLLLRLGVLALMIALVFVLGEVWRRASFRYVHDGRRRYQFLLMRRIVIWVSVAIIVVLGFASELGSVVTFAGLITAGIAVAMQNVITSIVGYFFLIGKYGLRVGDRVTIAGVTGEVVEIGLVRIHVMELAGTNDAQPSGRIVAFSNSIVFQPTAGIFKQIPGTNFVWHELKLTLASETDYHAAKERIVKAVDAALAQYRENIATQRRLVEQNLTSVSAGELQAKVRLHYTASGIEATVRYPVELEKAADVDDHLMRELLAAVDKEPKLKLISAEMPAAKA
ncbi:MAG TPA: mechanosensitive ion channel domain-containing protein [Terriglobales bacterium]|nr:mechanosensitive ion channel domain-containing protein [Terriglobales bacterium]